MAAPAAPAPAAPVLPPTAFLMALKNNVNVSAACVAGETRDGLGRQYVRLANGGWIRRRDGYETAHEYDGMDWIV